MICLFYSYAYLHFFIYFYIFLCNFSDFHTSYLVAVFVYLKSSLSHSAHSVYFWSGGYTGTTPHDARSLQKLSKHVQAYTSDRGWHT